MLSEDLPLHLKQRIEEAWLLIDRKELQPESLEALFPEFKEALARDAEQGLLTFWGRSSHVDCSEGKEIVEPGLLSMLHGWAGHNKNETGFHAGVTHTYGYLFSRLLTKYGRKRDRWIHGFLEKDLSLLEDTFCPLPCEGTFLGNVSFFLAHLTGVSDLKGWEAAPATLRKIDWLSVPTRRMVEIYPVGREDWAFGVIDVFGLSAQRHWVAYSLQESLTEPMRWISLFPTEPNTAAALLSRHAGEPEPGPRFNAVSRHSHDVWSKPFARVEVPARMHPHEARASTGMW